MLAWSNQPGQKIWGVDAQLYLLRSERNWGIGDFTDLCNLIDIAAGWGASVVGLNPLHALFIEDPEHASPYEPASRLYLNILNMIRKRLESCYLVKAKCAAGVLRRIKIGFKGAVGVSMMRRSADLSCLLCFAARFPDLLGLTQTFSFRRIYRLPRFACLFIDLAIGQTRRILIVAQPSVDSGIISLRAGP